MADEKHTRVARQILGVVTVGSVLDVDVFARDVSEILRSEYGERAAKAEHVAFALEVDDLADQLATKIDLLGSMLAMAAMRLTRIRNGSCDCADFENREDLSQHGPECHRRIADVTLKEIVDG